MYKVLSINDYLAANLQIYIYLNLRESSFNPHQIFIRDGPSGIQDAPDQSYEQYELHVVNVKSLIILIYIFLLKQSVENLTIWWYHCLVLKCLKFTK